MPGASKVQSVLVPKLYPVEKAIDWVVSHGFVARKVDVAENFYRSRQHPPKKTEKYFTKVLPNGVELVIAVGKTPLAK